MVDDAGLSTLLQVPMLKEALIKSNYFMLVKTARNFPEDRINRVTINAHFEEVTNSFSCA